MSTPWKTVRVFISSTFRDMQTERDWLVKRVFPALRQRLEPHRIHLVDIDLRWGITREQADNDQVLGLCLQQIDECRPFFLGLLGGRYGWVPSRFPVEVGKRYGWTQHHTGKSVTELEILHGVLNDPAMHGRALFCFREEQFLSAITDEPQRRIYVEGPTDEEWHDLAPEEAERRAADRRRQLAGLKQQIKKLTPPVPLLDGYPCWWNPALLDPVSKIPGRLDGLKEFGNWVIEKLEHSILNAPELEEHLATVRSKSRNELDEERGFHEQFIENRTRVYIGRQQLQKELKAFVTSAEMKPCLVTGPSGSGKSAALAKFVSVWRAQHPKEIIISHFVGASPRSTSLREMLRHLCEELKDALKLEDEIKQDVRELPDQFREFLAKVPADRRALLVLDALNQLDETDNAHTLYWLPTQMLTHVRLMVSCIDDLDRPDHLTVAAMRRHAPHEFKVGQLTDDERLGIVREISSVAAKTLDADQIGLLLQNPATKNPLFLLVALEELRGFGSFEELNRKMAGLPQTGDTLTAIFQQVIRRLGEDFNAVTVKDVLTLLACSRRGLSERELLGLLTPNQKSEIGKPQSDDLFPILRQLRPYLQSRGPLLDFYHRQLAKATHKEFFNQRETVQRDTHHSLANYFTDCAKGSDATLEWETDSVRGFAECIFHLTKSGQPDIAAGLLTNFPFLLHKLRVGLLEGVIEDYEILQREAPLDTAKQLEIWSDFFREKAHILRRGNKDWPAQKILLQVAIEHADDSPLTFGAEKWLTEDRCDWLWLRRIQRVPRIQQNPCIAVLEGHSDPINGALQLHDGKVLSWAANDNNLRIWDSQNGRCLAVLTGHSSQVIGALAFPDGRILSWAFDFTMRLWDNISCTCLRVFRGHSNFIRRALVLSDGRILSWAITMFEPRLDKDNTLRTWDTRSGESLRVLKGHPTGVLGALELSNGRIVSWGDDDRVLRLWDSHSGKCLTVLEGHTANIKGAVVFSDGRILSWANENTMRVWDSCSGSCLAVIEGHSNWILNVLILPDGRILSLADITLRIWDPTNYTCLLTLKGHANPAIGALAFNNSRILSWSNGA